MSEPWSRKEVIGSCELYLGDCLEVLPTLGRADAIITDPPFNAGKSFANDCMAEDDWAEFCYTLAGRLNAENILVEVGKNDKAMRHALDSHHPYKWAIALNYTNAMRNGAVGYANFGLVLWYGGRCYARYMDRIDSPLTNTKDQFEHPSPKEVAHYQALVKMFSPKGGLVSDPFMGSGTTGIACIKLGRKFIGIEIEPNYFDIACRRIEAAYAQPDIFIEAEKSVAVQTSIFDETEAA